MKIIVPIQITPSILDSSNVSASSMTAWSSGSTYTTGNEVVAINAEGIPHEYRWSPPTEDIVSATSVYPPITHYVTKLSDINPDAKSTDAVYRHYWLDLGPSNQYAMFSQRSRRATENSDSIEVEVTLGVLFNACALINVEAETVVIVVDDPTDGEVYNLSVDMLDLSNVNDFYSWCFAPIIRKTDIVLLDLPAYVDATITVTATDTGETVQIGEMVVGNLSDIGTMLYGATIGITDYSTKTKDESGLVTLKVGTYSRTIDFPLNVNTSELHYIQRLIASLRATPAVYVGKDDRQETVIYGTCENFSEVFSGPIKSACNLRVEELSL